jgi:FkbM family methyltransferase
MSNQNFYKLFYNPTINKITRSVLRPFRKVLPESLKIPVSGIISVYNQGKEIKFKTNETSPMTKILFWEDNGCTFEFSEIFKDLIIHSNTFFDIGANVGYYSLLAKTVNPKIEVYSFEPSIGPKHFLKENIALNNFNDIHLIEKALGDATGTIQFYEEKNPKYAYQKFHASGIGNTENTWGISNFLKYDVELTTINDVVASENIKSIDLIKIDTEGTENFVFRGGIESIKKFQPIIICEVLKDKIEDKIQEIIVNELNYLMFQFQSHSNKLIEITSIRECNKNRETNYFFVPVSKRNLIEKFIINNG